MDIPTIAGIAFVITTGLGVGVPLAFFCSLLMAPVFPPEIIRKTLFILPLVVMLHALLMVSVKYSP